MLEKELGKKLGTKEVAQYLGLDEKTVRSYYRELGGMRLGRRYVFFERRFIDAVQKRTKMDCPSQEGREEKEQSVSNKEGGHGLGSQDAAKTRQRLAKEDRHGLYR